MSLISTENYNIVLQTIKKLLSLKADKLDLDTKIDRSEVEEDDALAIVTEMSLVAPVSADDGAIYTDENGVIYTL